MSLAPAFLLSMPQLVDPNFNRTVVLLCRHSEKDGAFGVVVNRPLMTTGRVTVNLDPPASTDRELQLWVGGPVEPQRSWILVGHEGKADEDVGGERNLSGIYGGDAQAVNGPGDIAALLGNYDIMPGKTSIALVGYAVLITRKGGQLRGRS